MSILITLILSILTSLDAEAEQRWDHMEPPSTHDTQGPVGQWEPEDQRHEMEQPTYEP